MFCSGRHTRTRPSDMPAAKYLPSLLHPTQHTLALVPRSVSILWFENILLIIYKSFFYSFSFPVNNVLFGD
ncbi:hypothetical protein AYI68_g8232 [Smittium mucronatum]|uniref:Uncharacterized protein n=1 Tax=Smittium mucronatum TaxID=133383 RepID=A0A1R0GLG7_9FUNG|nr:hypothetical protein AYI68_g8232 [Smittium mucronatum]